MAFVGTKQIGQHQMQFHADGSVTGVKASGSSEISAPQKPSPQQVVEQVVEKAKEMVGIKPVPEIESEKPKARRGRKPKTSAESVSYTHLTLPTTD